MNYEENTNYEYDIDDEIKMKTLELIEEQIEDTKTHEKLCRNLNSIIVLAVIIFFIGLILGLLLLIKI